MMVTVVGQYLSAGECPDRHKHTKHPEGYLQFHAWAEKKMRTHEQVQCPTCGWWAIWKRRDKPLTKEQVEDILYPSEAEEIVVPVSLIPS